MWSYEILQDTHVCAFRSWILVKLNDRDLLLLSSSSGLSRAGQIVGPMRSFRQQLGAYCMVVRNTSEQESLV